MVQPLRESRDRYEELKQIDDAMNEVNSKHVCDICLVTGIFPTCFTMRVTGTEKEE